uniref:Bm1059 n=1 Tax=Brugia malayi TaxID=6279 RepID=A0A1I9G688_BRUMA|nr:Bm1059 [Brugia malayi]
MWPKVWMKAKVLRCAYQGERERERERGRELLRLFGSFCLERKIGGCWQSSRDKLRCFTYLDFPGQIK